MNEDRIRLDEEVSFQIQLMADALAREVASKTKKVGEGMALLCCALANIWLTQQRGRESPEHYAAEAQRIILSICKQYDFMMEAGQIAIIKQEFN